jgi:transcriptional regulator with XRE-family HTH domain
LHTIGCMVAFVEGAAVLPIEVRFGIALRRKREAVGISQEALAGAAGVHRNYVGLLERGKQVPSILVVEKLAVALGTTMSNLLRGAEKAAD